jgi:hypothetical protein
MNIKHKISKEQLEIAVKSCNTYGQLLSFFKIKKGGGNYTTIKNKLKLFNIDVSHWGTLRNRQGWLKGKSHDWSKIKIPMDKILIKDSSYTWTWNLKNRLIKEKILEYKCVKCKNEGNWLNQVLNLQLHHCNGIRNDNRLENLQLLCPNCHSQTDTFSGRNIKSW